GGGSVWLWGRSLQWENQQLQGVVEQRETVIGHLMLQGTQLRQALGTTKTYVAESITDAIGHGVAHIASDLNAACILCSTSSGSTARMVSRTRPPAPIIAAIAEKAHQLNLIFWTNRWKLSSMTGAVVLQTGVGNFGLNPEGRARRVRRGSMHAW
ncbi:MAG: hypothetical protein IH905_13770, partial [Proteobacteria bacterium]|nr:hypothetical protein [Pseudomonadota bacterium]